MLRRNPHKAGAALRCLVDPESSAGEPGRFVQPTFARHLFAVVRQRKFRIPCLLAHAEYISVTRPCDADRCNAVVFH